MAFSASYVNGKTIADILTGDLTADLNADTIKVALFTDSVGAGDKNASEAYGSGVWASNEVSGTGYTAGGATITSPSISTPDSGKWTFQSSASTVVWSSATFVARGAIVYDSTASNRILAVINFGEDKQVVSGNFTLSWDATNKIFSVTY